MKLKTHSYRRIPNKFRSDFIRIMPREVIKFLKYALNSVIKAYIAGFLDGDGSIYVKLTQKKDYRFGYQISPNLVFYQSQKNRKHLFWLKSILKTGFIRDRNDGMAEFIISDSKKLLQILLTTHPYVKLKTSQVKLCLRILKRMKRNISPYYFLETCRLVDRFGYINYSKKRKITSENVYKYLLERNLITP